MDHFADLIESNSNQLETRILIKTVVDHIHELIEMYSLDSLKETHNILKYILLANNYGFSPTNKNKFQIQDQFYLASDLAIKNENLVKEMKNFKKIDEEKYQEIMNAIWGDLEEISNWWLEEKLVNPYLDSDPLFWKIKIT